MNINEGDADKQINLKDQLDASLPSLAVAPDGGLAAGPVGLPRPLPQARPEDFVCLRGPCRHYVEIGSLADVEDRVDIADYRPMQINRMCRVIPGIQIDLTDDAVLDCNRWDPEDDDLALMARRVAFLKSPLGGKCQDADAARVAARAELYGSDEDAVHDSADETDDETAPHAPESDV